MTKYRFLWKNAHQLFYMLGNIDSYQKYRNILFNDANNVFQVSHESIMHCYLGEEDLSRSVKEGEIFLDREASKKYIADANKQCEAHQNFYKSLLDLDVQKASNEELLKYWQGLIDNYAHSVAYFRSTQEEPSRAIVEKVMSTVSEEDAEYTMLSTELDEINKEEVAWEELVASGFSEEKALEHVRKFPWLFQNSLEHSETAQELRERLENHVPRDIEQEKKELAKKQEKIFEKYTDIKDEIDTLLELAVLRPKVKGCWGSTGFYAKILLDEIAKRFDVNTRDLTFFYRSEDVDELLKSGRPLGDDEVKDRKIATAYIVKNGKLESEVGQKALDMEKETLGASEEDESVSELKGQPARKGKVTGIIRILKINDPEETKKFRESFDGEILVTAMTQPNVVDIAGKAKAIITDEGGMLCHAAIISREFGIPCIVGTHKATEVLKDGMEVEVDADSGVVKILK